MPSPTPSAAPASLDVTRDDLKMLLQALHYELTPNTGSVEVKIVAAAEMPSYDPIVHYAGMQANKHPLVLANKDAAHNQSTQDALGDAFLLAVMDDGEAGPTWKRIYDQAAAADSALPANSPDPYLNRHALTKSIRKATHLSS